MGFWGRWIACFAVILILSTSTLPVPAVAAAGNGIGNYVRLGNQGVLTQENVKRLGDEVSVSAPILSSAVKVDRSWLGQSLGTWGATSAFTIDQSDRVVFEGHTATFRTFVAGPEPLFTLGSNASVRLEERPMWISVTRTSDREIHIEMQDGDTTGQRIFLSEAWLQSLGIHRPHVVHEDGVELRVQEAVAAGGYWVEIPHFSFIIVSPANFEIKKREGGAVSPWLGVRQWDSEAKILELVVDPHMQPIELLAEKAWFDVNLPYPQSTMRFGAEQMGSKFYYSIALPASTAVVAVRFSWFSPGAPQVWTYGHPATVWAQGLNESVRLTGGPLYVGHTAAGGNITLNLTGSNPWADVFVSYTHLHAAGIYFPQVAAVSGTARPFFYETYDHVGIVIENVNEPVRIFGGGQDLLIENRTQTAYAAFMNDTKSLVVQTPAYSGWLHHGFDLLLADIPWGEAPWPGMPAIGSIAIQANGQVVAQANASDAGRGNMILVPGLVVPATAQIRVNYHVVEDVLQQVPGSTGISEDILWDIINEIPDVDGPIGEQCRTEVNKYHDSNRYHTDVVSSQPIEHKGYVTQFHRSYFNTCHPSQPVPVYETNFAFGWTSIAPTWITGYGTYSEVVGILVENSESTLHGDGMRRHLVKGPRVALTELYGSSLDATHLTVELTGQNFLNAEDCWLTDSQEKLVRTIDMGLAVGSGHLAWQPAVVLTVTWELFRPEQNCVESLQKYDATVNGYSAAGGRLVQANRDEHEDLVVAGEVYTSYISTWWIDGPSGATGGFWSQSSEQGRVTLAEYYQTCQGTAPCNASSRNWDYKSWWHNSSIWFQRP